MKIANPIYDVVFKYLMDDNKIAKLMISKIIGEEIESLDFQPKESVAKIERPPDSEIHQKDTEIGQKDQALNEKDKLIEELKRRLGE